MDNYEIGELLRLLEKIAVSLEKLTSDNSDYAKWGHVIALICDSLGITKNDCDESNLHDIYHKVVEIKTVTKELSQHFA